MMYTGFIPTRLSILLTTYFSIQPSNKLLAYKIKAVSSLSAPSFWNVFLITSFCSLEIWTQFWAILGNAKKSSTYIPLVLFKYGSLINISLKSWPRTTKQTKSFFSYNCREARVKVLKYSRINYLVSKRLSNFSWDPLTQQIALFPAFLG